MIRIAIIDDAVEIGTQLETILIEITTNKGIAIDIDIYYSGKELCEHLQNGEFYDLIFLDIEMPEFTGIDVSKMIRDNLKNDATQIAYISGNKEYAIEIFEYDPLYFVHKPINKEKIEKVFERLIHRLHLQADAFTYKTGHNIVKIPIKDIIYFESEDHQIIIHYYTQNEYHKDSFYGLLDHVQKQLKSFQFLRIHKTYLVHHLYVRKYAYDKVYLSTGIELPIAQSKRKEIRAEQFAINRKGVRMSLSNYDIVYACSELFSIYIIYYFFQSLFGTQIRNKVITISVYALYFVLTIGIHFVANIPFLNLIFTIISLFSISLCYNTTFPKRLLAILEYIVLGFAVELIVSVVTKNAYIEPLQRYEYENEIGIFLSRMVIFWIVLLLGYFSHHRNEQKILPIWTMFVSPCIPILTIGIELLFTTVSGVTAQSVTVSMILLFIINIVVFFLYESLSIAYARAAKATVAEQEKNYYQNQCQLMQNAVEDTRRFHHDISNHFSIVEAFLEGRKTNEASQYLQELIQKEEKKSVLYSTSGNIVVDSIINYKLRSISDWNVAVTVDIVIPTELPIEIVDLSTILTNLLDNAVQALQKTDGKRELKIAMTYRKGMLFIAVKNTYPGKVHYENGEIVTTKEDTESHGYGLKNVESAAEKYDGICQLHHNDVYFDAEVALYL